MSQKKESALQPKRQGTLCGAKKSDYEPVVLVVPVIVVSVGLIVPVIVVPSVMVIVPVMSVPVVMVVSVDMVMVVSVDMGSVLVMPVSVIMVSVFVVLCTSSFLQAKENMATANRATSVKAKDFFIGNSPFHL